MKICVKKKVAYKPDSVPSVQSGMGQNSSKLLWEENPKRLTQFMQFMRHFYQILKEMYVDFRF